MTQTEQFEADVLAIEPEGQEIFVYQGKSYRFQRAPSANRMAMVDAGYEAIEDFAMEVRTSQFTGDILPPAITDVVLLGDVEYRIATSTPDQYGVVITYGVKQNS